MRGRERGGAGGRTADRHKSGTWTRLTGTLPICGPCGEYGIHIGLVCLGGASRQRPP